MFHVPLSLLNTTVSCSSIHWGMLGDALDFLSLSYFVLFICFYVLYALPLFTFTIPFRFQPSLFSLAFHHHPFCHGGWRGRIFSVCIQSHFTPCCLFVTLPLNQTQHTCLKFKHVHATLFVIVYVDAVYEMQAPRSFIASHEEQLLKARIANYYKWRA